MADKAIPESVLAVLRHRWKDIDPDYSAFESIFNDKEDKPRRSDPSYYHINRGKKVEHDFDVFSHEEAAQLVKEGAFGSMAKVGDGGGVVINEHAQHALTDFCSEVYSAWSKYRRRLAKVERICPPMNE